MSQFSLSLKAFAEKTDAKIERTVKRIIAGVAESVIEMSPVGDANYWQINDVAQFKRDAFQAFRVESGKAPVSARTLKKNFPMAAPKGYTGGHFRANWDFGTGQAPSDQYDVIDATGAASRQRIQDGIGAAKLVGGKHYVVNNLPYAERLENGWSRQAPNGMVGLTVVKFQSIVDAAVQS